MNQNQDLAAEQPTEPMANNTTEAPEAEIAAEKTVESESPSALEIWQNLPPEVAREIYSEIQKEVVQTLHSKGVLAVPKGQPEPEKPTHEVEPPERIIRKHLERELYDSAKKLETGQLSINDFILDALAATAKVTTGLNASLTQRQIREATSGLEQLAYLNTRDAFYRQNPDVAGYADIINPLIETEGGPNAAQIVGAIKEIEKRVKARALQRREEEGHYVDSHIESPRGGGRVHGITGRELDALSDQIVNAHRAGDSQKVSKLMRKWMSLK